MSSKSIILPLLLLGFCVTFIPRSRYQVGKATRTTAIRSSRSNTWVGCTRRITIILLRLLAIDGYDHPLFVIVVDGSILHIDG